MIYEVNNEEMVRNNVMLTKEDGKIENSNYSIQEYNTIHTVISLSHILYPEASLNKPMEGFT